MDVGRYKNKPFLLMLEGYMLDAIGELSPDMERLVKTVSSKFFGKGDWRKLLRHQVGFDASLGKQVKQLWDENREIAKKKGAELDPYDFVQALVEANFAELIEMVNEDLEAENAEDD